MEDKCGEEDVERALDDGACETFVILGDAWGLTDDDDNGSSKTDEVDNFSSKTDEVGNGSSKTEEIDDDSSKDQLEDGEGWS